eukprot:TRINITY_DN17989_c0_g1_i1.p1 TRINITY_DN17989_c0_g1~~TRINITY_DN17989_c0_g1_i1.p1  ORF type:complete len:225 (-),score=22.48 TRINITY_DN17989_c0_g1_i1:70-744(-)
MSKLVATPYDFDDDWGSMDEFDVPLVQTQPSVLSQLSNGNKGNSPITRPDIPSSLSPVSTSLSATSPVSTSTTPSVTSSVSTSSPATSPVSTSSQSSIENLSSCIPNVRFLMPGVLITIFALWVFSVLSVLLYNFGMALGIITFPIGFYGIWKSEKRILLIYLYSAVLDILLMFAFTYYLSNLGYFPLFFEFLFVLLKAVIGYYCYILWVQLNSSESTNVVSVV